jgi:thiol-disulfide isomerase/thioredoxin
MWLSALTALALAAPPATPAPAPQSATTSTASTTTAATATAPAPAAVKAGATTFSPVNDQDYGRLVLAPRAGKVVLVNFWASYCLPCLEEMPALVKLREQFKDDVEVVFVSTDDADLLPKAGKVLERWKIGVADSFYVTNEDPDPFIAVVDPAWLGAIPHTVVYGRDGAIVRKLAGGQSAATFEESLRAAIALPVKTPATPTTTAPTTATKK